MTMRQVSLTLDVLPSGALRSGMSPTRAGENICLLFGGYTAHYSFGCWRPGPADDLVHDPSITFTVAIHPADWPKFKEMAQVLADGQETVYVVGPVGQVEVLSVGALIEHAPAPVPDEGPCDGPGGQAFCDGRDLSPYDIGRVPPTPDSLGG